MWTRCVVRCVWVAAKRLLLDLSGRWRSISRTAPPQVDLRFTEAAPQQIQDDVRHGLLDVELVYAWQADSDLR